jgi:orotidine-5'-phosphate decarboxylase
MKSFADRLVAQIRSKNSLVCVGLDPRIEGPGNIPSFLIEDAGGDPNQAIWLFNKAIIDATKSVAAIFKPQSAFYEQYEAYDALKKTLRYLREHDCLSILDAKRNDIGTTAEAYAIAGFDKLGADAITVNGYLGIDGVKPFLEYIPKGKGIFLLLKTSNKSSGEFQDLFSVNLGEINATITSSELKNQSAVRNYLQMTRLMTKWAQSADNCKTTEMFGESGYLSVGGVVGATYPEQMEAVRSEAPKSFLLIPGYGAQGGTAKDIMHGVNPDGLGAIVNASRSINFAYTQKPYSSRFSAEEFAMAAAESARDMQQDINIAIAARKI